MIFQVTWTIWSESSASYPVESKVGPKCHQSRLMMVMKTELCISPLFKKQYYKLACNLQVLFRDVHHNFVNHINETKNKYGASAYSAAITCVSYYGQTNITETRVDKLSKLKLDPFEESQRIINYKSNIMGTIFVGKSRFCSKSFRGNAGWCGCGILNFWLFFRYIRKGFNCDSFLN